MCIRDRPRPLPDEHRPLQEVAAAGHRGARRPDRGRFGGRPVEDLAHVRERGGLRYEGPPVPHGRVLLHLRPALVPLPARLRLRRGRALGDRRGRRALPVRRTARDQPRRPGHRRRDRAPVGAARPLRLPQGARVLARPVRARREVQRLQGRRQLDGPAVRRRERLPAGQDDPRGHRRDLRRAVLRDAVAPHLAAAGHRLRPDGALRDPDRRALPGDRAEVPGPAERAGQGIPVRPEEHQGHARRLRDRRLRGDGLPGLPADAGPRQAAAGGRHHGQHPAPRPEHRLARLPAAPAGQGLLRLPVHARRGPVQRPGHGHRAARAEHRRHPEEQLDQRPLQVHARLRRGRGQGHHRR